jgi:hypothetical protein
MHAPDSAHKAMKSQTLVQQLYEWQVFAACICGKGHIWLSSCAAAYFTFEVNPSCAAAAAGEGSRQVQGPMLMEQL